MRQAARRRLFVPLKTEPFEWFRAGDKDWEVRRNAGAFEASRLVPGQRAELRMGYVGRSLWGTIREIRIGEPWYLINAIPFQRVIPTAGSIDEARAFIEELLGDSGELAAIKIELDAEPTQQHVGFDPEYLHLVETGDKTTTIRLGHRDIEPGPAVFHFGPEVEREGAITGVSYCRVEDLTERDASDDGFLSLGDLIQALKRHYPDMTSTSPVTILEFRCRRE